MRLALYQPDIAANVGAMIRLSACLGLPLDIIEPCGFPLGDKDIRRVAMDYRALAEIVRHASWHEFVKKGLRENDRLVLLTTAAEARYVDFAYAASDVIVVGREGRGAPDEVHRAADARIRVPMTAGARSLNVAIAAAMVLGEALRQTGAFAGGGERGLR